jgi:hypothetical protein
LNTERSVPIRNPAPKTYASDNPRPVFGRERELGLLSEAMQQSGPRVIHVHGISGIGKSALISEFAAIWRGKKRTVLLLDGRAIEPTESGFQHELSRQLTDRQADTWRYCPHALQEKQSCGDCSRFIRVPWFARRLAATGLPEPAGKECASDPGEPLRTRTTMDRDTRMAGIVPLA